MATVCRTKAQHRKEQGVTRASVPDPQQTKIPGLTSLPWLLSEGYKTRRVRIRTHTHDVTFRR